DCVGPIVSAGYNADSDATCRLDAPTDQRAANLLLGAIGDHGGGSATYLPSSDSPLIDAIPPGMPGACDASLPTDQRGSLRPIGSGCDIGSVEGSTGTASQPLSLTVDDATD